MKLVYNKDGKQVDIGDELDLWGTKVRVEFIFPPFQNMVRVSYYLSIGGPVHIERSPAALGMAWVDGAETTSAAPVSAISVAESVQKIDYREAKWENVSGFLQEQINVANGEENAELAEALNFAKLYAEGQLATVRDIGGMFF